MKTALITGGTSGIGLSIAKGLLHLGWHVLIIGRSDVSCCRASAHVPTVWHDRLIMFSADLAEKDQTLRAARQIADRLHTHHGGRLDLMIGNAGSFSSGMSSEGIPRALAVQCFSFLWLFDSMKDMLLRSDAPKVILTEGLLHRFIVNKDIAEWMNSHDPFKSHCRAELGANWLALALKTENEKITFYTVDPRWVDSKLGEKADSRWIRGLWRMLAPFGMTPAKASGTYIMLAQAAKTIKADHLADRMVSGVSSCACDSAAAMAFLNYVRHK